MKLPGSLVSALDTVMDRSVVLGYTRLGFVARHAQWDELDPEPGSLIGATALVTGANSGLGKAATAGLAELGARVIMVVRNMDKGRQAADEIRAEHPAAELHLEPCDVSSLSSVRELAQRLHNSERSLDVIVHNAGTLPAERTESADGHELTLATHVLGPLLLTELLRPQLRAASGARVIMMSSGGMYTQKLPANDPEYRVGEYKGAAAYARSKRIQVAFAPLLAQRLADDNIRVYAMHPGWANTPGIVTSLPGFSSMLRPLLRSAEEGADTAVWLAATKPAPATGLFWHDRRDRPDQLLPWTRYSSAERASIWRYCLDAAGIDQSASSTTSESKNEDQSDAVSVTNNRQNPPKAESEPDDSMDVAKENLP